MSTGGGPKFGLSTENPLIELEGAWKEREAEAGLLLSHHHATAIALRVYAIEIRIKTLICKRLGLDYLPNHCKTHDLAELILFSGHLKELDDPANVELRKNWDILVKFSKERLNNLRYATTAGLADPDRDAVLKALDDPDAGVWTWLSSVP